MNGYETLVVARRMDDLRAAAEQHRLARAATQETRSTSIGRRLARIGFRSARPAPTMTASGI